MPHSQGCVGCVFFFQNNDIVFSGNFEGTELAASHVVGAVGGI